jgi:hypothetical protein
VMLLNRNSIFLVDMRNLIFAMLVAIEK